jgi:hypothetical protein
MVERISPLTLKPLDELRGVGILKLLVDARFDAFFLCPGNRTLDNAEDGNDEPAARRVFHVKLSNTRPPESRKGLTPRTKILCNSS